MESSLKIETNQQFQDTIATLGINSFIDSANIDTSFVFVTSDFFPLYFDFSTNDYMVFHGKPKWRAQTTCIDISDDKKYVVTGHSNGSISLWSIPDNFTFIKSYQKIHKENVSITRVKFGKDSETIYVGDESGVVTHITVTVIIKAYKFTEKLIYDGSKVLNNDKTGPSELIDIVTSRLNDPFPIGFLVYDEYYVTFDPTALQLITFTTQDKKLIVYVSQKQLGQPSISLLPREQDFFMNISIGSSLKMLQIRDVNSTIPLLSSIKFPNETITKTLFLSSSLIIVLTLNKTIQLMLYNGDIVARYRSEELNAILDDPVSTNLRVFPYLNEKLVFVKNNTVYFVSFADWETIISDMANNQQWAAAFKSLSEIHLDLSCKLIGIPTNQAIKRNRVRALGKKLLIEYFQQILDTQNDDQLLDSVANGIVNAVTLELHNVITEDIYPLFKEKSLLAKFYEGIKKGGDSIFAFLCNSQFVSNYIDFCIAKQISDYESYLLKLSYNDTQIKPLLDICVKHKLLKLFSHIYLRYLNDCIPIIEFYYEEGKLMDFYDFAFNEIDHKSEFSDMTIKLIRDVSLIWLLVTNESGEFNRFNSFCKMNWEKSLYYVAIFCQLLESSPIYYNFRDKLELKHIIEAILRVLNDEEYEIAETFLIVVMPYVSKHSIEISDYSIKHVLKWIFNSNSKNTDREIILRQVVRKHPNMIPPTTLAHFCERSYFISFMMDIYMPQKAYVRILTAMIINSGYRNQCFDFLKRIADDNKAENNEEVNKNLKAALFSCCQALILIDARKFAAFVADSFPNEIDNIIDLLKPQERLIFLLNLQEINYELNAKQKLLTFQFLLQFSPQMAPHYLAENIMDIDINKARDLSIKYNRVDCQVSIKVYLRQYKEAIEQVGSEIEKRLLDFIESGSEENPESIYELNEMVDMKPCLEIIDTSLEILKTISKDNNDKMAFQKAYLYFLFPMYHAQMNGKESIKQSVALMFSYFIVGSMDIISAHHAFLILSIHFSNLAPDMFRLLLFNISSRIDYHKRILNGLDEMLTNDCLDLIDNVYLQQNKGTEVSEFQCCICQGKLDSTKYCNWFVYPCGHICHVDCYTTLKESMKKTKNDNENKCPQCYILQSHTNEVAINRDAQNDAPKKLTSREVQRIMRRYQFALKRNFGDQIKENETANASFFSAAPEMESFDNEPLVDIDEILPPTDSVIFVINKNE